MSSNPYDPELQLDGGLPPISFKIHEVRSGSVDGARAEFEQMITQLVGSILPGVRAVKANPGDWGIDAFVGDLANGTIAIWQSKYFIDGIEKAQQAQIRESLKAAMGAASANGHRLGGWILCIPTSMDGPSSAWWDRWKKKKERECKIEIELWDDTELIRRLNSPEGRSVRRAYYHLGSTPLTPSSPVVSVPDDLDFEGALFVRQLRKAGHTELDGAKREFFNAELLAREVRDKGVPQEVESLCSAEATAHSLWEHRYNAACEESESDLLPGLHRRVMQDVRSERGTFMTHIATSLIHACGMVHRVVEERRAGWVRDWRSVAASHSAAIEDPEPVSADAELPS